jgi:membrane-associated phospholipid phosphatase
MTKTDDETTIAVTESTVGLDGALDQPTLGSLGSRRSPRQWFSYRWSDPGRRRVLIGWSVLIASLVVYFFVAGIPWSLDWVFIYIMAGIIISSLGSGVKWKRLLVDWLPLFLVLWGYGLLRGYASSPIWGPFVRPQVWFDTHVAGFGVDPTVQLQRWLYTPGLHFWDYMVWCCYMTHFFASFIIAAVLWKTNYPKFRRYVPLFVALTFFGYVTYVLYPAMPPWMAGDTTLPHSDHFLPHVTRIIPLVLDHLHLHTGAAIFTGGPKFDNNIAAMPSLHAAYPMLICLFFWKGSSVRKRVLLAAYPICMAFTLVYTGEHFVLDVVMGWIYAAATIYFGSKVLNRWELRRVRKGLDDDGPWTSMIGEGPTRRSRRAQAKAGDQVPVGA